MHRRFLRFAAAFVWGAVVLCLAGCDSLSRAVQVPAHFVSHQMCSAVFVGRLDADEFYREGVELFVGPGAPFIAYRIDREHSEVDASFAHFVRSRSVYRGEMGCQVARGAVPGASADMPAQGASVDMPEPGASTDAPTPGATAAQPSPGAPTGQTGAVAMEPPKVLPRAVSASTSRPLGDESANSSILIAGRAVVEPSSPALQSALDRAFAEPSRPPHRWTKAVVVVHDGRIVAERYAPGYGIDTPLLGWSLTKSVTNALLGILVRQGRLSVDTPAPVAAWSNPTDPRHNITIDQLLRMTSGLELGQSLAPDWKSPFDPSVQMEFDTPDMAAFAERAKLNASPGTKWSYANGNTLILSRIIRDSAGGNAGAVMQFAHRELFDKLGMEQVTLEFDATGTPIGSSHMWASARDWARFGLLYLNDGVIGGESVLPPNWIEYSARFTPGSEKFGYGAGFWTNRGSSPAARSRVSAGMPADSFMARGAQGQYIIVVPAAKLVIVRLGMAYTPLADIAAMERLVADVVAATHD